jgi:hypothetical protein
MIIRGFCNLRHLYQNDERKTKKNNYSNVKLLLCFQGNATTFKIFKTLDFVVIINVIKVHDNFIN